MSAVKKKPAALPLICRRLNQLSHTHGYDSEQAKTCTEAALEIQKLRATLKALVAQNETRLIFSGATVKDVREAGKWVAANDAAKALLLELGKAS